MAKLGSEENPLILNVHNEYDLDLATQVCAMNGWKYIISINPDEPRDLRDLDRKMAPIIRKHRPPPETVGRNQFCPCGSGMKFKKCCLPKSHTPFKDLKTLHGLT